MKLAVFDCDGTLIDGQASICAAMEQAFAEHGLPLPPRNLIRRAVGLSLPQAIRTLLPEAEGEQYLALTEAYKRAFRTARQSGELQQPLFDGMAQLLDGLRGAGWLLGVATGMSRRGLEHCLATHSLSGHFITLQTADDHPSKPHPAMLEAALLEAGAEPHEAVMIGDTVFDMAMADAARVRGIGVEWGYHAPSELLASGAAEVAATPLQLGEISGTMSYDPLSGSPAPDALAKQRFMAIQVMRLFGVALFVFGIVIIRGILPLPRVAGYVLAVVGIFDAFMMPVILARRWKSPTQMRFLAK